MTVKSTRKCMKLANWSDQVSSSDFISTKYITDCVKKDTLLNTTMYKLPIKKATEKAEKRSADDDDDKSDLSDDDMSPAKLIISQPRLIQGRTAYTLEEDMKIIDYVLENKTNREMFGNIIWQDMERLKITNHSAQSMQDRFKKRILPNINRYSIPNESKYKLTGDIKYLKDSSKSDRCKSSVKKSELTTVQAKEAVPSNFVRNLEEEEGKEDDDCFDQGLITSLPEKQGHVSHTSLEKRRKAMCTSPVSQEEITHTLPVVQGEVSSSTVLETSESKTMTNSFNSACKQKHIIRDDDREDDILPTLRSKAASTIQTKDKYSFLNTFDLITTRTRKKRKFTDLCSSEKREESQDETSQTPQKHLEDKTGKRKTFDPTSPDRLQFITNDEAHTDTQYDDHNAEDDSTENKTTLEENREIIKEIAKKYKMKIKEVIFALFINNGSVPDTIEWILTGENLAGVDPWDFRDDEPLKAAKAEDIQNLIGKYTKERVNERLLFLEGL